MNIIFSRCLCGSFALLSLFAGRSFAQKPEAGFFTLVIAVDLPTNTIVSVDGKVLRPDGLKSGKVTGALGFIEGGHRIDATNGSCKPVSASLQLTAGKPLIVILYLVQSRGPDGRIVNELRISSQPSTASTKPKAFTALYVGQRNLGALAINGQTQILKPLQPVALGKVSSVSISQNGQAIGSFNQLEPGNYIVVLFDKQDAHLGALLVQDVAYTQAGRKS